MRSVSLAVLSFACLQACTIVTSRPTAARIERAEAPAQGASDKYGPEPGESLLQLGGALTSQTTSTGFGADQTTTNLALQGGIGYFANDWLEVGGQVFGTFSMPDSGSDTVLVSISPYANANFKIRPRVWLYAGPHAGLAYFDFSNDTATSLAYGLHGGARYWLTPRASLFGEGRFTRSEFDLNSISIDSDTFELLFGFNLVF